MNKTLLPSTGRRAAGQRLLLHPHAGAPGRAGQHPAANAASTSTAAADIPWQQFYTDPACSR
jgi:hypothetical protein